MQEYVTCEPSTLTGKECQISTTEDNVYECMDEATYENIGKFKVSIDTFPSPYSKATNIYEPVYMNTWLFLWIQVYVIDIKMLQLLSLLICSML